MKPKWKDKKRLIDWNSTCLRSIEDLYLGHRLRCITILYVFFILLIINFPFIIK